MSDDMDIILGIDLGTTFSAVASMNAHGKPQMIPNSEGKRTTPSVVFFQEDGTPIVGELARNQALVDPTRTVQFIKREMGNPSFRLSIDGLEYYPEGISALILKKLRSDAEAALGKDIRKAVISVPAYFKDAQRRATQVAGEIAGLEVMAIINEPTAAALAYGFGKHSVRQNLLVYDFGAGRSTSPSSGWTATNSRCWPPMATRIWGVSTSISVSSTTWPSNSWRSTRRISAWIRTPDRTFSSGPSGPRSTCRLARASW